MPIILHPCDSFHYLAILAKVAEVELLPCCQCPETAESHV